MRPDLVICCCGGSQADYIPIVGKHWDKRFLFNRLPPPEFIDALFDQQKVLAEAGQTRNVGRRPPSTRTSATRSQRWGTEGATTTYPCGSSPYPS